MESQIGLAEGDFSLYPGSMRPLGFRIVPLVLVILSGCGESLPPSVAPDAVAAKALLIAVGRTVGSYNSVDIAGIRRQFSVLAPGLTDDGAYRRLFFGYYLVELGRVKSMRLIPADSNFDPDRAMLVYEAAFDYWPRVKVSANFTRENGTPKLLQLRFEKIETGT